MNLCRPLRILNMLWSKYFIPTLKETPIGVEAMSHQFLLRGGFVHMLTSGFIPICLWA